MKKGVVLVSLLVLGWVGTLQGVPLLPEPLYPTQENFDLGRFLGKWYEVAVVSTCPYFMQRQRANPVIATLELKRGSTEVKMTGSIPRQGACKQISADYGLTYTSGRFFYHVAKFGADVDSYVVHTDYDEYAVVVMMSTEKASGDKTIIVKLYSRTIDVRPTVLDDFKRLVREQGINDDTVVIKQYKGECVPGEPTVHPEPQMERS